MYWKTSSGHYGLDEYILDLSVPPVYGTYSKIQKADPINLTFPVAVKSYAKIQCSSPDIPIFLPGGEIKMTSALEKLEGELELLWELPDHPNIIKPLKVVDDEGHCILYVVYRFYPYPLMKWNGRFNCYEIPTSNKQIPSTSNSSKRYKILVYKENSAKRIFREILEAVNHLHSMQIIHKDLKPDNILLTGAPSESEIGYLEISEASDNPEASYSETLENFQDEFLWEGCETKEIKFEVDDSARSLPTDASPVIIDFNTAIKLKDSSLAIFDAEGTKAFSPPECFNVTLEDKKIDGRKRDSWSLGVVLFVMLFGKLPFCHGNPMQLIMCIMKDPLVIPNNPATSIEAQNLLEGLLEKDPACRMDTKDAKEAQWFKSEDSNLNVK